VTTYYHKRLSPQVEVVLKMYAVQLSIVSSLFRSLWEMEPTVKVTISCTNKDHCLSVWVGA
jgi:hypothetical protein